MAQADIDSMVAGFVTSASNVAAAGLDGVELHGAHGWLIGQFLSPMFNRRTDAYGGSTEARCRLALEIAQAVRDHRRASCSGCSSPSTSTSATSGSRPEETDRQVEILAGSGLFDYVSLSTGSQFSRHRTIPPIGTPDAVLAEHGRRAREIAAGRTAIALLGRIRHVATAARLLDEGAADIVAMTRAHLAEPAMVRRTQGRRGGTVTPCVGENECLSRAFAGRQVTCVLNPMTGRERAWPMPRAGRRATAARHRRRRRAGGAARRRGGRRARPRGHAARAERGGRRPSRAAGPAARAGGLARGRRVPRARRDAPRARGAPRRGRDGGAGRRGRAGRRPRRDRRGLGGRRARPRPARRAAHRRRGRAHVVDVETAARRALADARPPSAGTSSSSTRAARSCPSASPRSSAAAGARVEIVTRRPQVGARLHATLQAPEVFGRLAALDVHLRPGHGVVRIADRRVELTETLVRPPAAVLEDVDTVVLALRRAPRDGLAAELRDAGLEVHVIGDARSPRRAAEAIHDGERIGRAL